MEHLLPGIGASDAVDAALLFAVVALGFVGLGKGAADTASGLFAWGLALLAALWGWTALAGPVSSVVPDPLAASALAAALPFALVAGTGLAARRRLRALARGVPGALDGALGAALGVLVGAGAVATGWAGAKAALGDDDLAADARSLPLMSLLAAPAAEPMDRLLGDVLAAAFAPLDAERAASPEAEAMRRLESQLTRAAARLTRAKIGELAGLGVDEVAELDIDALEMVQEINGFEGLEGLDETRGFETIARLEDLGRVVDADDLRAVRDDAVRLLHALQAEGRLPDLPGADSSLPPLEDFGDPERLRDIFADIDAGADYGSELIPDFDPDDEGTLLPTAGSRFFLKDQAPIVVPDREDLPEVRGRGARDFLLHIHDSAVRLEENRRRLEAEDAAEAKAGAKAEGPVGLVDETAGERR